MANHSAYFPDPHSPSPQATNLLPIATLKSLRSSSIFCFFSWILNIPSPFFPTGSFSTFIHSFIYLFNICEHFVCDRHRVLRETTVKNPDKVLVSLSLLFSGKSNQQLMKSSKAISHRGKSSGQGKELKNAAELLEMVWCCCLHVLWMLRMKENERRKIILREREKMRREIKTKSLKVSTIGTFYREW